jgi:hypothetical protein
MTSSYCFNPRLTKYALTSASSHSTIGVPGDDGFGDTAVIADQEMVRAMEGREGEGWGAERG